MRSFKSKLGRGTCTELTQGANRVGFHPDGAVQISGSVVGTSMNLAYASVVEIPVAKAKTFHLTIEGDCEITVPEEVFDGDWRVYLKMDSVGGHIVTFGGNLLNVYNTDVPRTADSTTLLSIFSRGNGKFDYSLAAVKTV